MKTADAWYAEGIAALELSRSADTLRELKGDHERAEAAFRQALALDPTHPLALFQLGATLAKLDRHLEAAEVLQTAQACGADHPNLPLIRARALQDGGRLDDALQVWEEVLLFRPQVFDAAYGKARCLSALERHHEAIAAWDAVLALPKEKSLSHYDQLRAPFLRAVSVARVGRKEEAVAAFRAAFPPAPEPPWSAIDAVDFPSLLRDVEAARVAFQEHLATLPPKAVTWKLAGEKWSRAGRTTEALEAYEAALALDPNNGDIVWGKAEVLAKLGRLEEAIALMRTALSLNPVAVLGIKARLAVMEKELAARSR